MHPAEERIVDKDIKPPYSQLHPQQTRQNIYSGGSNVYFWWRGEINSKKQATYMDCRF
jgi:hypothetical protein